MAYFETPEQKEARRRSNPYSKRTPRDPITVVTATGPTSGRPAYTGPVIERIHTENHTFGNRTHRTKMRITKAFAPGLNGDPAALFNCDAYCGELQQRLWLIERTVRAVDAHNNAQIAGELSQPGAEDLSFSLRQGINGTLASQMEFFLRCAEGFGLTEEIRQLREERAKLEGAEIILHIPIRG